MTSLPPNEPPPPDSPPPGAGSAFPGGDAGDAGGSGKRSDRDIVAGALEAAKPRSNGPGVGDDALPAADAFPGYEIIREIHRGGQGVVYQAIQKATKRKVALKVLHGGPFVGSKGRARFEREVAILAQLDHPNVVGVIDSGTSVGQAFYVMDYISGQTLDAWMAGDPKPIAEILPLFTKICEAVNAAHLKGITHRDLKPSNIRIDHSGEPHILDFGLAKVVIGEVTEETQPQMMSMTGQFIGSLPWASPEQAEGAPDKVDLRTDVYSLGVILYQLLTGGKFPYDVIGNMREVLDNILRAEPAKPSTIRHKINDEVETIVLKALQKERDRRYQTAGELARDVRRYLSGEPIEAMRDSGWYVIRKTLRKYQVPTAVAAIFLVVVIAFGITSFVLYRDAEHSRSVTATALEEKGIALGVAETAKKRAENLNAAYERVSAAGRDLRRRTLTDYYQRIANLVGATSAKEALLRDGLAYLETLRKEASTDPTFREELADALEAVGRIEAGMYTARVGKTSDGEKHLAEAVDIGQKLVDEKPMEPARRVRLSRSTLQLAQVIRQAQRFDEAIRMVESSLAHAERGVILLGDGGADAGLVDEAKTARANANVALGELKIRQGQKAGAYAATEALTKEGESRYDIAGAYWKERAARDPKDAKAARLVVVMEDKKSQPAMFRAAAMAVEARALADAGKLDEARPKYDEALRIYEGAATLSTESVRAFRALNERFKGDADIMRSVCVSLRNVGDALTRRGELEAELATKYNDPGRRTRARALQEQAFSPLSESVAAARAAASTDAKNLDAQRAVYATLVKLGAQQRALGKLLAGEGAGDAALAARAKELLEEASKTFDEARAQAEFVSELDPTNLHRSDLVNIDLRLAETSADQGRYAQAIGAYERAIALMDNLPDEGGFGKSSTEYSDAKKALGECRAKVGTPGDK